MPSGDGPAAVAGPAVAAAAAAAAAVERGPAGDGRDDPARPCRRIDRRWAAAGCRATGPSPGGMTRPAMPHESAQSGRQRRPAPNRPGHAAGAIGLARGGIGGGNRPGSGGPGSVAVAAIGPGSGRNRRRQSARHRRPRPGRRWR